MRKLVLCFVSVLIMCMAPFVSARAMGSGRAYYTTYDEFVMIKDSSTIAKTVSPYDSYTLGGGASQDTLNDTNKYDNVIFKRDFNKVEGEFVWELCFNAESAPEGSLLALRAGEKAAVEIYKTSDGMALRTPDKAVAIEGDASGFYGITAHINLENGTYDMQVNGQTIGTSLKMLYKPEYLDNFYAETTKEGTGSITLSAMRISSGYSVNESFIDSHKKIPDEWKNLGGSSLVPMKSGIANDVYSLKIQDDDFVGESGVSRCLSYDTDDLWLEFQFLIPEQISEFGAALQSEGNNLIRIGAKGTEYGYWLDDKFTCVYSMKKNLWYHAMVKLTENGAQVYINHKLVAENIPVERKKADSIQIMTGMAAIGTVYVDDIVAKAIYPLPEDYVSKPTVPQKNTDILIGVQSCNIWREGTHFGWDYLSSFPERKTYLGYYDEGSSEVRDWETKWMVEHGIDYEMYCWYRQPTSNSVPIKTPRNSYELHEGFFNSEYSDMMKFAIAWENGGTASAGAEDFETNIVPYWIEQYFKDDRYLKIDNKPVISIYQLSSLARDFGSEAQIRAELNYLESACRAEGFDGAYILMTSTATDKTTLERMKYIGIDAIYAYSWGTENCSSSTLQEMCMTNQRDTDAINMMPTIGMGRDDAPWERGRGGFMEPEDLKALLSWAKDEFIPSLESGSLGSRMLMLDNWNEYGEGHFFMPSELKGFAYLDAVREVFCNNYEHTDVRPDEAAMARFNRLYVQDRNIGKAYSVIKYDKERENSEYEVMRDFCFDDESTDLYPVAKQIENYEIKSGVLCGTATDTDPGFYINDINISAANIKKISVGFKADTPSTNFQIYFVTQESQNWQEAKSLTQNVILNGDFVDVILDTSQSNLWTGTITSMRVDPMNTVGSFEIDSIELLGKEEKPLLYIDGEKIMPSREIQIEDGVMYAPADEIATYFDYSYSNTIDKKYLNMLNTDTASTLSFEYGTDAIKFDGQSYFPLRAVAEAAGCSVEWDEEKGCAIVTSGDEYTIPDAEDPAGTYNFYEPGSYEGFYDMANISNSSVAKGVWKMTAATSDPNIKTMLNASADEYSYVNIRMQNKTAGNYIKVYFITDKDSAWNESKCVSAELLPSSAGFAVYSLRLADNVYWTGNITTVRIDPTDSAGDVVIDYIIFSKEAAKESSDGENILRGGVMDTNELEYYTEGLDAAYTVEESWLGRKSLELKSGNNNAYVRFPANIQNGKEYAVTFKLKAKNDGEITVGTCSESSLQKIKASEYTTGEWVSFSASFTAAEAADGIYIMTSAGTIYLDGIKLAEKTSSETN